ncbi:MAG: hypothetical protein Q9161_006162 [Pseudevernia consocians]
MSAPNPTKPPTPTTRNLTTDTDLLFELHQILHDFATWLLDLLIKLHSFILLVAKWIWIGLTLWWRCTVVLLFVLLVVLGVNVLSLSLIGICAREKDSGETGGDDVILRNSSGPHLFGQSSLCADGVLTHITLPNDTSGGISFALLPSLLLARMIPNARSPARQETATMAAITMPAMAPEDIFEDDLEALGLLDGLDTSEDEDVVASALDK